MSERETPQEPDEPSPDTPENQAARESEEQASKDQDKQVITPTIGIGIGKGGSRMLASLYELAESEGIGDDFAYIGIDTNEDELRENLPRQEENVTTIHLEKPNFWKQDKEDFGYLNDALLNVRSLNNAGVTRTRTVARYHVDSLQNLETVRTKLEGRIQAFYDGYDKYFDREGGNEINIWVMNSLGGGTGSGSFVIISALVDYLIQNNITGADPGQFSLMGIGTLPRLDYLESGGGSPDDAEFQSNAYAAIRELRVLLGEDESNGIRIPLESDREGQQDIGVLEPTPPVFTRYFLLGGDKNKTGSDRSYTTNLNRAAANLPHYFARLDSQKNFPDGVSNLRDERLWSFNAYEVRSPLGKIDDYFDIQEEIQRLDGVIQETQDDINKYANDIRYLQRVSELKLGHLRDLDGELSEVSLSEALDVPNIELIDRCKSRAIGFRMDQFRRDKLEKDIETINEDHEENVELLDHELVVAYYYYQMFVKRLEDEMASHSAKDVIQSIWADFHGPLQQDFAHLQEAGAIQKWEDGLERFLAQRKRNLQKQMDARISYLSPFWWKAWWKHRQIQTTRDRGADAYNEYEYLDRAAEILEERYESAQTELEEKKASFETTRGNLRSQKDSLEKQKQNEKETLLDTIHGLTTHYIEDERIIELPIRDPESVLTPETTEEAESISWFETREIISERDIARAFIDVLGERLDEEPLQNLQSKREEYERLLGILIHEDNRYLLETEQGEENVQDLWRGNFRNSQQEEQTIADGHSIWFLGLYTDLVLENTSEYGVIDDFYRSKGDEGVMSLFNLNDSPHYMTSRFAHPEFFVDDPDIGEMVKEYFPLGRRVK